VSILTLNWCVDIDYRLSPVVIAVAV